MSSFTTAESEIEALYIGYFGRAGDPAGMQYWESQLTTGALTLAQVAASFSVQAESKALYPFLANPLLDDAAHDNAAAFINSVFMDLFNHGETAASDPTGFAYWLTQVEAGASNPQLIGQMIENIISGAPAGSADDLTLQNKVTVGDFFTTSMAAANAAYNAAAATLAHSVIAGTTSTSTTVTTEDAAITSYLSSPPPTGGQTFTLTTGTDVLPGLIGNLGTTDTSGNDIIIGQNIGAATTWTLNPSDQINAGGGTFNQLKLFSDGTAPPVAQAQFPTLTAVQGLWINHIGANASDAIATPFDITTSKFASVTSLQLDDIGGGTTTGPIYVKLAHQTLTVSNDGAYGGEFVAIYSPVDTSENVTFSGAGKSTAHDKIALFGTAAAGSADTGLTIFSTGSANFVDYWGVSTNNLASITFAHSVAGDTAFTGSQTFGSTLSETIDASAFTGALTLGVTGAALAVATGFGDGRSGFGDTVKLGSGTTYFAESAVTNVMVGDNITLLAGHTAIDTLDSTATTNAMQNAAYGSSTNDINAMSIVTNFNLGNNTIGSGDVLKMGVTTEAVGSATDIGTVNGHLYTNVGTGTGIVSGGGVTTAAQFLADVTATTTTATTGDVVATVIGGNTYVAEFNWTGHANSVVLVELVGVAATSVSLTGGTTGQIHIA
jgi:hypothetical protein